MTTDPTGTTAWIDTHGDVWTLGADGLMHSPETRPFPPEHVERKWGPLRPVQQPADPTGTGTIPQEAVDAAYREYRASDLDGRAVIRDMLAAALPILRAQWEAERRDRIRSRSSGFTMVGSAVAELSDEVDRLTADLAAARQQLDAVRALHRKVPVYDYCSHEDPEACGAFEVNAGEWVCGEPIAYVCEVCLDSDNDGIAYPCPTALAVAPTDAPVTTADHDGCCDACVAKYRRHEDPTFVMPDNTDAPATKDGQ